MTRSPSRTLLAVTAVALTAAACSAGPATSISDQTIPPQTGAPDREAGPTRTLPPDGTGPRSTVGRVGIAAIERFDLPERITCDLGAELTITASYTTSKASAVRFLINGQPVDATPPVQGSFDLPIACDGSVHTIVITAIDADGGTTVASRAVLTNADPIGD